MDGEGEGGEIDVVENSSVPNASSATETTIDSFARKLRVKYPQLMIHNSVAPKDGTKFLHIWKLSKQNNADDAGPEYLPCFHAIVVPSEDSHSINLSLFSYHGRLLNFLSVPSDTLEEEEEKNPFHVLDKMALDAIVMCEGICDLKETDPAPNKGLNVLTEVFGAKRIVARSRNCDFAVFADGVNTDYPRVQCYNCKSFRASPMKSLKCETTLDQDIHPHEDERPPSAVSVSNGTNVECQVVIDENVVSGVDGVDHDVKKSRRGAVMKEEEDLESDGGGGGFDLLGGGGEVDDDLVDVTPDIKQIKQEETKPQVSVVANPALLKLKNFGITVMPTTEITAKEKLQTVKKEQTSFYDEEKPLMIPPQKRSKPGPKSRKRRRKVMMDDNSDEDSDDDNSDEDYVPGGGTFSRKKSKPKSMLLPPPQSLGITITAASSGGLGGFSRAGGVAGGKPVNSRRPPPVQPGQPDGAGQPPRQIGFKCRACLIAYSTRELMQKCMAGHRKHINFDEEVDCPKCEEKIESRLMATQHWSKNHRGGGESVCCACLEVLPISRLSRHILKSHHAPSKPAREPRAPKGDGSGGQRGRPKGAKGDPKVISYDQKCPVCLSKYKCASERDNCLKRHRESMSDLDASVSCPACQVEVGKMELTQHFASVHADMFLTCCVQCLEMVSSEQGTLRKHIITDHHSAAKSLLCSDCGFVAHSKRVLETHVNEVHLKIFDSHFCEQCGRTFSSSYKYKRHLDLHREMTLKCLHCDKLFNRRVQLLNHLFMHTKLKPFKCSICNYSNDRKGNVADHVKKVHKKSSNFYADVNTDMEELKLMRKICKREADLIQGYKNGLRHPRYRDPKWLEDPSAKYNNLGQEDDDSQPSEQILKDETDAVQHMSHR